MIIVYYLFVHMNAVAAFHVKEWSKILCFYTRAFNVLRKIEYTQHAYFSNYVNFQNFM